MQRAEMEELRQREANLTALQAIGPRKKPKLDTAGSTSSGSTSGANASTSGLNRQMPMRPRVKRVNYRDLLFLFEQEKDTCRSTTLYKSYLKWCIMKGRNLSDPPEIWRCIIICMVLYELASMDRETFLYVAMYSVFHCESCVSQSNLLVESRLGIPHTFKLKNCFHHVDTLLPYCKWLNIF